MREPCTNHGRTAWPALALAVGCSVAAAGCQVNVGQLQLALVRSSVSAEEPLVGLAEKLRIRVDGPDGRVGPLEFALDAERIELPDVSTGEGRIITVEGLGTAGTPVSRGRSAPLTIEPGQNRIELFVGVIGEFSNVPRAAGGKRRAMLQRRAFHTATRLESGDVLLTGGVTKGWRPESGERPTPAPTVERIDSNSLRFATIDCDAPDGSAFCLETRRVGHTATLLPETGNVMIAGGTDKDDRSPISLIEIYSTHTHRFLKSTRGLNVPRLFHAATVFEGRAAFAGGSTAAGTPTSSVESHAEGAVQVRALPSLSRARRNLAMVTAGAEGSGTLVASGGLSDRGAPLGTVEVLSGSRWRKVGTLKAPRAYHTATALSDGSVLFIGGLAKDGSAVDLIERYDPKSGELSAVGRLRFSRWAHAATELAPGVVMVTGGFGAHRSGAPLDVAERVTVRSGTVNVTRGPPMATRRAGHTATLIRSGLLLVSGGLTQCSAKESCSTKPTDTAEVLVY